MLLQTNPACDFQYFYGIFFFFPERERERKDQETKATARTGGEREKQIPGLIFFFFLKGLRKQNNQSIMRVSPPLRYPDSLRLLAAKDTNRSHKILKSSRNLTG